MKEKGYCGFISIRHALILMDLMKITVSRMHEFMENDPINTTCYYKLHFDEHCYRGSTLHRNPRILMKPQ